MTGNVTSIAKVRAAARRRSDSARVNTRVASILLVTVAVLLVMGLGEILSASSIRGIADAEDRFFYFKRQLIGLVVGVIAMVAIARIPYRAYLRLAMPFYLTSLGLLGAVWVAGLARNGSRRWLDLGFVTFQPSELSKLAVIIALAALLERKGNLVNQAGHFSGPLLLTVGLTCGFILLQPDLGTALVVAAAALAVTLVSRAPFKFVVGVCALAVVAGLVLSVTEGYRMDRIDSFLDPWADPSGNGYQVIQGYYALGTGGLFGVGLGASRARWSYLPNAHTDFIFAIIGEETGLVGAMMVIALCLVIALVGWSIASRAPDRFGRMVAAGITGWLSFQALTNIGGVLGVLPITGIVLPFVSFGSTALISCLAGVGVLVNIAQHGTEKGSGK
ncbi:MAG TPA: putative lipid II flippase FtsW [Acidimicrobiia bacterium]|nr:putative lipid II flippase FtsW [Acidimicrobiia bacterium]